MKIKALSTVLLCAFFSLVLLPASQAQKKLKQGVITYELVSDFDEPGMEMLKGTEVKLAFMGKKSRMDMRMMGGMLSMTTIADADHPEATKLLFDMMGQKLEVEVSPDEAPDMQLLPQAEGQAVWTKEKKKIAGYKCRKAVVKMPDGGTAEFWLAKKINPADNPMTAQVANLKGKGMPLEFKVNQGGVELVFRAKSVSPEVDASMFEVPEGYQKVTAEELQQMMGQ